MKNLLNFFFSFDKLFKEKLIAPAFWLALIYFGLKALVRMFDVLGLDPINYLVAPIAFFVGLAFMLLVIRIVAELAIATFRINDNLAPDKGKSELVDIDPVAEARKAAQIAADRTRELTHTATERTKSTLSDARATVADTTDTLAGKARDTAQNAKARTESVMGKGSVPEPGDEPTPVKILEPSAADAPTVKKRGPGRPKGSKNKPKPTAAATAEAPVKRGPGRPKGSKNKPKTAIAPTRTAKKPGPKKGTPIPRDADGNLLKKDGTPRKKPGPKPKTDS